MTTNSRRRLKLAAALLTSVVVVCLVAANVFPDCVMAAYFEARRIAAAAQVEKLPVQDRTPTNVMPTPAAHGDGCGKTPPLNRAIVNADVEGETIVSAIYRFAHRNGVCIGLVLKDNALLRPVPKTVFANTSVGQVLRTLLPSSYRTREQGRVVVIEPTTGAPSWLSQRIPRFRLRRPEIVRMTVLASLYMDYEMARDPKRTGFMGDVMGSDPTNMVGPLDEGNKTMLELLNIIAERSRGAVWVGVPERSRGARWGGVPSQKYEFIEFQQPEERGVSMLRWITDLMR